MYFKKIIGTTVKMCMSISVCYNTDFSGAVVLWWHQAQSTKFTQTIDVVNARVTVRDEAIS